MKTYSFIFFFCLISGVSVFGQKNYIEGYIVTNSGDTLHGFIKDRTPEPYVKLYTKIRFKKSLKARKKKFSATQIDAYAKGNEVFKSLPYRSEQNIFKVTYHTRPGDPKRFFRVVRTSEDLIHLEMEYIHDDNFYLDFVPFLYKPGSSEMVRATQGVLGLKKKRLAEYFFDCDTLLKALEEKPSQLKTVGDVYNLYIESCAK